MPVGSINADIVNDVSGGPSIVLPASFMSNYQTLIGDLSAADNSGNVILNPVASITRATIKRLFILGRGTTLRVRAMYRQGLTFTISPVVQVFGLDAQAIPIPERLLDTNDAHELTLSIASATDTQFTDAAGITWGLTEAKELDMNAAASILAGVKTAATGTAAAALLIGRIK